MSASSDGWLGWLRHPLQQQNESAATGSASVTGGGTDNEPVVVWEAANALEAQVVKGRLESEGIPAIVRGEALGAIYGLTTGGLAATDVLVPAPLAQKALEVLGQGEVEPDEEGSAGDAGDAPAAGHDSGEE
jgi:hypothetical protein